MNRGKGRPLAWRLMLLGLLCWALSGCTPEARNTLAEDAAPAASTVAAMQPLQQGIVVPSATPIPPVGLQSAPEQAPQAVIQPEAAAATTAGQSLASSSAAAAQMEAEYLAVVLAEEATQVLLDTTQSLAAEQISQAEAMAYQMAMEMVIESAEQVLGVPEGSLSEIPISEEQMAAAMQVAQQALPVVVETMEGLEDGSVTPEQAAQELQGALWQFQHAHQTAQQTMTQRQQQGQACINEAQMQRLQTRARSQTQQALQAMQRMQNGQGEAMAEKAGTARQGGNAARRGGQ